MLTGERIEVWYDQVQRCYFVVHMNGDYVLETIENHGIRNEAEARTLQVETAERKNLPAEFSFCRSIPPGPFSREAT